MIIENFRKMMLPLNKIDLALPKNGTIYEIGAGLGVIASYLAKKSNNRRIICIDIDENKINKLEKNNSLKNLEIRIGDAVNFKYEDIHGAVMSDFLHHLNYSMQIKVLRNIVQSTKLGGVLVIKEINKNDGILRMLSRIWDFILYPYDKIYYRSVADWKKILCSLGFSVYVSRQVLWFPGSTFLFICTKK